MSARANSEAVPEMPKTCPKCGSRVNKSARRRMDGTVELRWVCMSPLCSYSKKRDGFE